MFFTPKFFLALLQVFFVNLLLLIQLFNIIDDLLNFQLSLSLILLLELTIEHGSINARIKLISMEGIAHAIGKLIENLPVIQLHIVLYEISHTIVFAEVLQLRQLLPILVHCVTLGHLGLKLLLFLSFLLQLSDLAHHENLKINRFLTLPLPLPHIRTDLLEIMLQLLHLFLVDMVDQVQQLPLHVLVLGRYQLLNVYFPSKMLLFLSFVH
jgi:hypothetical protein